MFYFAQSLDEHGHMMFILNNLNAMLELLVEPGTSIHDHLFIDPLLDKF